MFLVIGRWPLGPIVCDLWLCIDYTMSNASVANLLIICFDRWVNRCIRVLSTEILGNISVARTRTLGRGERPLLYEFRIDFNSSARAERSFAIRYLNVVIKPLCGNLDICPTTTFGHGILFACFRSQIATECERCFFGSRFSVARLRDLADLADPQPLGTIRSGL